MPDTNPSMADIILRAIASGLLDVHTATVGRVEAFDPATDTADIQPMIRRPLPTEDDSVEYETLPVIPNVPVIFPRGGGCYVRWRLKPGDFVQLQFLMSDVSQWRQSGEVSNPDNLRAHGPGSAVAIPGIVSNAGALPAVDVDTLTLEAADVILLGAGATDPIALAPGVTAWLDAMLAAMLVAPGGSISVTAPTDYPTTGDIASTKVNAK